MKRGYKRSDRVGALLQQEISALILRQLKDPRTQGLTITAVEVSDDLRNARVFFNTAMSEASAKDAQAGLDHAAGFLRREIGKRLDLKYLPNLRFQYDESFDRGSRMDEMLAGMPAAKSAGDEGGADGE